MFESGKTTPVITKAYEVAYALSRVAAKIPEKGFSETVMNEGVKTLGFVAEGDYEKAKRSLAAAEYFIKLGVGIGSIDFSNGELLLGEIAQLNDAIAGLSNTPKTEPADLSGIFNPIVFPVVPANSSVIPAKAGIQVSDKGNSGSRVVARDDKKEARGEENIPTSSVVVPVLDRVEDKLRSDIQDSIPSVIPDLVGNPSGFDFGTEKMDPRLRQDDKKDSGNENDMGVLLKSGERQSVILGKIRQSGNCRIKDLQDIFPGCSERTLRYDLQSLTEQNLIEKVGTGGPAVFYKSRG